MGRKNKRRSKPGKRQRSRSGRKEATVRTIAENSYENGEIMMFCNDVLLEQVRGSKLWREFVDEFDEDEAEELLMAALLYDQLECTCEDKNP